MSFSVAIDDLVGIPKGGGTWIRIYDLNGQAGVVVSDKTFRDANNEILDTATASGLTVAVSIRASHPEVSVNGGPSVDLTPSADSGFFEGIVNVTLVGSGDLTAQVTDPDGKEGAIDTIVVTVDTPPELVSLSFSGGYPGLQTELKAGDTFQLTGTLDKPGDAIEVQDFEASDSVQLLPFALGTSFTVTMVIGDRGTTVQDLAARVRARNTAGAFGSTRDTDTGGGSTDGVNTVKLNNLFPTVVIGTITYPPTQGALKGSETATVAMTTSDLDTISFDSPNGDLSITNPTTDETPKTVTRIAGSYNDSVNNFRATANRAANDATTVDQVVVVIANVAPTIVVTEPAARLRSGGADGTAVQDHTITITSDQQLASAPMMDEDVGGGTFVGAFTGGPTVWTRTLQVDDADTKGAYTWQNLVATGLSGLVQNTIDTSGGNDDTYVLGGFVPRDVTFPAFSQNGIINVEVIDYTKLTAGIFTATNQPSTRNPVQGDTSNLADTYTVTALGVNPTTVFWNDQSAAASNSSGTAQLLQIEETV